MLSVGRSLVCRAICLLCDNIRNHAFDVVIACIQIREKSPQTLSHLVFASVLHSFALPHPASATQWRVGAWIYKIVDAVFSPISSGESKPTDWQGVDWHENNPSESGFGRCRPASFQRYSELASLRCNASSACLRWVMSLPPIRFQRSLLFIEDGLIRPNNQNSPPVSTQVFTLALRYD